MAYSAGFSPHPKISYIGAAPTGVASEGEYLEIGLAQEVDVEELRAALDAALPEGLDVVEAVLAGSGSLAARMEASHWHVELPGVEPAALADALKQFLALDEVLVERLTKEGKRSLDARGAVIFADVSSSAGASNAHPRAILDMVVRQATPAIRPDDVLAGLRVVAGLAPDAAPIAVRLAQGPLDDSGAVGDPLAPDRAGTGSAS
jgi:radical SAM-linked protein